MARTQGRAFRASGSAWAGEAEAWGGSFIAESLITKMPRKKIVLKNFKEGSVRGDRAEAEDRRPAFPNLLGEITLPKT
jgi:hypothetical protein